MPRLSDYTFTPSDFFRFITWTFRRLITASLYDWTGLVLLAALGLGLHKFTSLGFDSIFFWVFSGWLFWFNIDARVSIGGALAGLVTIPLLLFLGDRGFAFGETGSEEVAVWVYFFLAIGVSKQVWDMVREGRTRKHDMLLPTNPEIDSVSTEPMIHTNVEIPLVHTRKLPRRVPREATLPTQVSLSPAPRRRPVPIMGDGVIRLRRKSS